jgi:hypothetical protein
MPDLDLIKQGKQMKRWFLENRPDASPGFPSLRITGAVQILVFLIY